MKILANTVIFSDQVVSLGINQMKSGFLTDIITVFVFLALFGNEVLCFVLCFGVEFLCCLSLFHILVQLR